MSRVDAHHHVWDLSVREQSWMAGPELDPIRQTFLIDDCTATPPVSSSHARAAGLRQPRTASWTSAHQPSASRRLSPSHVALLYVP